MAFDPDKYISDDSAPKSGAGFDPDSYLSGDTQPKDSGGIGSKALGVLDKVTDYNPFMIGTKYVAKKIAEAPSTAVEHFGNSAAMGYLPQLEAATEPAFNKVADLVTGNHVSDGDHSTYLQRRDDEIKRLAQEAQDNPASAKIGDIAGALTSGVAMSGAAPINAASKMGRMVQAGKLGGLIGAASNPGDTEGEIDPLQLGSRAVNAAGDAAIGMAGQGAAELAGSAGSKASDYFQNRAGEKAAKAIGIDKPAAKVLLQKYGPDAVTDLGQTALNEDLVGPFQTPEKIAVNAGKAKSAAGAEFGGLLDEADAGGAPKISAKDIALELSGDPSLEALKKTPGAEGMYDKVMGQLQTLYNNGDAMSLREAQALRQSVDKWVNFNKAVPELRGVQENLYNVRDSIAGKMNDSVNSYQGNNADALKAAGRKYSDLSRIEDIATKRSAGNAANRAIGLTDTISGAGGAGAGAAIGGMAGGIHGAELGAVAGEGVGMGLNKLARTFGPGTDAVMSNAMSKVLANAPDLQRLVASNPAAMPMLMQMMGRNNQQSSSPESIFGPQIMDQLKQHPELIDNIQDPKLKEMANKALGRDTASVPPTKDYVSPQDAKQKFLEGGQ